MRQQDRAGEALEIQIADGFDGGNGAAFLFFNDVACGRIGQFVFGFLQAAIGLLAGATLAPCAAVGFVAHGKHHFGKTMTAVARHDFVFAFADGFQARGLTKQTQAYGIQ